MIFAELLRNNPRWKNWSYRRRG